MSNSLWPHESQHAGLPVYHQLLEFTQTHVHWVGDAIQPSHPLSSPSPPAPNPSKHQGLFQWVNSSHEVATEQVLKLHNSVFLINFSSLQWLSVFWPVIKLMVKAGRLILLETWKSKEDNKSFVYKMIYLCTSFEVQHQAQTQVYKPYEFVFLFASC